MSSVITVEIAGQRYPIRSVLDERYVTELAAYVDQKMRSAADSAPASDMLGLAVLVALNVADELFRERNQQQQQHTSATGDLNERAMRLERIVDEALARVAAS
jgi:cell division protein ZapA